MRLPGTRYQEHGWEQVRKLLGHCALEVLAAPLLLRLTDAANATDALAEFLDALAARLHAHARRARGEAPGNSYGDTVAELALTLVYELRARPADGAAFLAALQATRQGPGSAEQAAILRKQVNDVFTVLRDKVDSDNYQAACGRPCSPNRMYAYRMLDTAQGELARLFAAWREHRAQVGAILGRSLDAEPIEARQLRGAAGCRPEWILRWSATLEQFGGTTGPLHTRSKRFAGLKDNPEKIGAMLREIGEYEALSANGDRDWLQDASDAGAWLDDYWRVLGESEQAGTPGPDQILEARQDELDLPVPDVADADDDAAEALLDADLAQRVSLSPRYLQMAAAAQERGSWALRLMEGDSLPVRLAVYLKLLGPFDDSYPGEWLDPATGELPTMQQLALLDQVSLPTLRKRRDAAIARLGAAASKEES
jgi:hypothetical protein